MRLIVKFPVDNKEFAIIVKVGIFRREAHLYENVPDELFLQPRYADVSLHTMKQRRRIRRFKKIRLRNNSGNTD